MTVPTEILNELGGDERAAVENLQTQISELLTKVNTNTQRVNENINAIGSIVNSGGMPSAVNTATINFGLALMTRLAELEPGAQVALLNMLANNATNATISPVDGS